MGLSARISFDQRPHCHYCGSGLLSAHEPAGLQRPDEVATRDHTKPRCDGGRDWVLACRQCNQIKGCDPYEIFEGFMQHGGRGLHRHQRKAAYRRFREQIMQIGLLYLEEAAGAGCPDAETLLRGSAA